MSEHKTHIRMSDGRLVDFCVTDWLVQQTTKCLRALVKQNRMPVHDMKTDWQNEVVCYLYTQWQHDGQPQVNQAWVRAQLGPVILSR